MNVVTKSGLWSRYEAFVMGRFLSGQQPTDAPNISYWRDRVFAKIVTYFLPCGLIALVPGVYLSFHTGHWVIGVMDVLTLVLVLATVGLHRLSLTLRKVAFLGTIYGLAMVLTTMLSLFGPGMIYMLTASVLTTLILPKRWGYVSAVANLLLCIACAEVFSTGIIPSPLQSYSIDAWIAVSSNLIFLSLVVVAVLNHAIDGVEERLINDAVLRTEYQKVIRDLKHTERRLTQAQAIAHVGSWEVTFATGIALWSEEACRIYGLDEHDKIQSYENWVSYNHPDDNEEMMRLIDEARATLSSAGMYHRIIRKDGQVRYLYSESHYEFDEHGQPVGMYGIAQDITEERERQEELRKSNERFELVNRAAREAILDWDIVQDRTFWGNGFTEIFGYQPEAYHNHLLSQNIHPEDREEALDALRRILDDPAKNTLYREFRYLKADRSTAHVQVRTVLVRNPSGSAIRAVSSLVDVTDLVRKNKVLEKQNSTLREIAWIQSHEVRSPLAAILGLVELLKHRATYELDEAKLISDLQSSAEKLDGVIREIVRKTEALEFPAEGAPDELDAEATVIARSWSA